MAIIDSQGLFLGDRLALCSDEAQLHWPRLYAAANNLARMELNYRKVVTKAYANFNHPPTEEQFWGWIREYKENFLLFVYQANGVLWGQWQTNERYLPKYKTAEDRRSPVPPSAAQEAFRAEYKRRKSEVSQQNQQFTDLLQDAPSCSELVGFTRVGVGEGVGVGNTPQPPSGEGGKKPTRAQVKQAKQTAAASVGMFRPEREMTADEERDMQLGYWRNQRIRGSPIYAKEAPAWVKTILENERASA